MKRIITKGRIISTKRKTTSADGNPQYYVSFEDEKENYFWGVTASNAACAYGCDSSKYKESAEITYHITRNGNVIVDYIK